VRIKDISKLTQTLPTTIRYYEREKLIEPAERLSNGYRIFNSRHIVQIKLCRLVFREFFNKKLRRASFQILNAAARRDMQQCVANINTYLLLVDEELQKVYRVFEEIERSEGSSGETHINLSMAEAAECVGTTKGAVRNWERNGLLCSQFSTYQKRQYCEADIKRMKVIYMLLQTGYSVMAIHKYFSALAQNQENAIQFLIDPQTNEDLFSIKDKWLKSLLTAKEYG